jgi:hypothetical protein
MHNVLDFEVFQVEQDGYRDMYGQALNRGADTLAAFTQHTPAPTLRQRRRRSEPDMGGINRVMFQGSDEENEENEEPHRHLPGPVRMQDSPQQQCLPTEQPPPVVPVLPEPQRTFFDRLRILMCVEDTEEAKALSWIVGTRRLTPARLIVFEEQMLKDSGEFYGAFGDEIFRRMFLLVVEFVKAGNALGDEVTLQQIRQAVRDTAVRDTAVRDTAVRDTAVRDTAVRDTAVRDTAAGAIYADATRRPPSQDVGSSNSTSSYTSAPGIPPVISYETRNAYEASTAVGEVEVRLSCVCFVCLIHRILIIISHPSQTVYSLGEQSSVGGSTLHGLALRPVTNANIIDQPDALRNNPGWWRTAAREKDLEKALKKDGIANMEDVDVTEAWSSPFE